VRNEQASGSGKSRLIKMRRESILFVCRKIMKQPGLTAAAIEEA